MSLCQPENADFSCGACCGFLNLKISKEELFGILRQRTEDFKNIVDFKKNHSIATFRQLSESKESELEKFDNTTYNCPFLGFIDTDSKKIGCMIHPVKTNDPKSQNFSFYGTSICQGYDCKNKERPTAQVWEKFLTKNDYSSIEYSAIVSDHISLEFIENFFAEFGFPSIDYLIKTQAKLLNKIFLHKLDAKANTALLYPTSFEIHYPCYANSTFHALCERLSIPKESELYLELHDLSNNSFYHHLDNQIVEI